MIKLIVICMLSIFSTSLLAGEIFNPPGCEYSVEFPSTPKKYNLQQTIGDGSTVPLYGAQLTVSGGKALVKAECGASSQEITNQFTDKNMYKYMEVLAKDTGLARSSFNVETNTLGKVGILTGKKDSSRGRLIVRIFNYIGSNSIMTVYIASLSKDFQTQEMVSFSKSIKRK